MDKGIYGYILRHSKRQQLVITAITICSFPFLYSALELPKIIVNDALTGTDFPKVLFGIELDQVEYLLTLCGLLLLLLVVNALFLMGINTYKNITSERMTRRLRYMLYQRILRFPLPHFQRVSQGELSTMLAGEVELIREFIADAIALPLFQGGTLLVILVFMFAQDPILGAASVALIPFQAYVIPKLQRKINLFNKERVERARKLSGRVGESVSGIRDIRTNNTAVFSQADFSKHLEGLYWVRYRLFRTKYFMKALNVFLLKLTPLLFYSVGGLLIINGRLTVGALVAALGAYANLTAPWKELLKYYQRRGDAQIKYQQLFSSFELATLLNEKMLEADTSPSERLEGTLALDAVTVVDEDGSKSLDGVSFEVPAGRRLAVVSGAIGRDKLAETIMRVAPPSQGVVRVGGQDLKTLSEGSLGRTIGYAGADTYIFDGTVGYNASYGLQHKIPENPDESDYDVDEARASGNCPYDIKQDWTDLTAACCANTGQLETWWFQVIRAVELEDVMLRTALNGSVDETRSPDLPAKILEARKHIAARLGANEDLGELVRRFEWRAYNQAASVGVNLLFGQPTDERFAFENFGENATIRGILQKVGIDERFQEIGLEVARELVDIFGDQGADQGLLDRFSFVDPATIERLSHLLAKAESGLTSLGEKERGELISLTAQISVERHRLAVIDQDLQDKIVEARELLHETLSEEEKSGIAIFDPDAFIPALSIRGNLVMGRNNQQRANSEQKVNEMLREVLTEMDLLEDVIKVAIGAEVGIGGQRMALAARQSLALARNLIKRPAILVINDALNAHDREARDRIRQNIVTLLPEMTLIWIDSEMPKAEDFDEVLVLRNGRVDKRIVEAKEEVIEADEEEEEETPLAIRAEAAALARVPLFREIRPSSLKLLAFGGKRVHFERGEVLFRQGDPGDNAYVILSGEVDVLLNLDTEHETHVARSGKDQLLGEIALLATIPRTAAARAFSEVEVLEIDKDIFLQIIQNEPKVAANVARIASERLASTLQQLEKAA